MGEEAKSWLCCRSSLGDGKGRRLLMTEEVTEADNPSHNPEGRRRRLCIRDDALAQS